METSTLETFAGKMGSVEELSVTLAPFGWDVGFQQLSRGSGAVDLKVLSSASTTLLRVGLEAQVHQLSVPPEGTITFGVPTQAQAQGKIGRRVLHSESLTRFSRNPGFDVVSAPNFSAYTFTTTTERLQQTAEMMGLPATTVAEELTTLQTLPDLKQLAVLRQRFALYLQSADHCHGRAATNLANEFETEICQLVLHTWNSARATPYIKRSNRSRLLRRAMEYVHSRPGEVFSVEELCRESACSLSTLERAFREQFGVSPKQYLIALRLSGVRRHLLGKQQVTIGEVATRWGFWHMSKFAADYKRMFGELPSATRSAV